MRAALPISIAAATLLWTGGLAVAQSSAGQSAEQTPAMQGRTGPTATTSGSAQEKAERDESKTSSQNAADEAQAGQHTRAMGKDTKSQSDLDSEIRTK